MITESSLLVKKRTLKKVHVRFLRRRQEDEDYEVDADTKLLSTEGKVFRIGTSTVMEEKNRKLHVGPDYQNSIFKISDILVENGPLNKIVSVKLQATGLQYISWEYAAKRLRSYGDLSLATWADKIDNFYKSFDRVVNEFDTKFKESRLSSENFWNQYQIEAQKACKRIESKFDKFYKFDYFLSKNVVHESSYSEGLYKALGYTDEESFISDIQKNGLPGVFDGDSAIYLNCVKHLLTLEGFFGNLIYQFPEERPYMKFRDGSRSRVTAHAFYIFEPTSIGFISHYYYVITKIGTTSDDDPSSDDFHSMFSKCHKGINGLTIS